MWCLLAKVIGASAKWTPFAQMRIKSMHRAQEVIMITCHHRKLYQFVLSAPTLLNAMVKADATKMDPEENESDVQISNVTK